MCIALAALSILCGAVHGKVFLSRGTASDAAAVLESMDCESIYSAAGSLNGSPGHIRIFGINNSFRDVVAHINSSLEVDLDTGTSVTTGHVKTKGSASRLTALRLPQTRRTVVIQFEQEPHSYRQSVTPPPPGSSACLPRLSGSKSVFLLKNSDTGSELGITTAALTPHEAYLQMTDSLNKSGWTQVTEQNRGVTGNMRVFLKKQDICVVSAEAGKGRRSARIAILKKTQ